MPGDPALLRLQSQIASAIGHASVADLITEVDTELAMRRKVWGGRGVYGRDFEDKRHQLHYDRLAAVGELLRSNGSTLERYLAHMAEAIKPRRFEELKHEVERELTMRRKVWNGYPVGRHWRFDRADHSRRYNLLASIREALLVLEPHFAAPDLLDLLDEMESAG